MFLKWLLYASLVLSWAAVLYFLCACIRRWFRNEPSAAAAWLVFLALTASAALPAVFLAPRGGYDNEHDVAMLSTDFFPPTVTVIMRFKEIAPLFTNWVSDALSGHSLNALLWKNALLQGLSVFVFFLGLRRLGAGLGTASASAAFLGFNFLLLLNAAAFSSTSSNMFIWLVSLLALAETYAAREVGAGLLCWVVCSLVLVAGARYEFLPVNMLLLGVILASRERAGLKDWRRPLNLGILGVSAVLLGAWAFLLAGVGGSPAAQLGEHLSPLANFLHQLGDRNFGVFTDFGRALAVLFTVLFAAAGLAGGLVKRERFPEAAAAFAVLVAWTAYFSFIYRAQDQYPLHFMRHQLYFFVPFAYLFAFGAAGFGVIWEALSPRRSLLRLLCGIFMMFYAALNLRAALGLNRELRTNDRELAFLASARAGWPADSELLLDESDDHMTAFLRKYFPAFNACGPGLERKLLKYRSARDQVFFFPRKTCQGLSRAQFAALPADAGAAFRESVFFHGFYTCWPEAEARDGREVRIGFYQADSEKDSAWKLASRGSCLLRGGDAAEAVALFKKAVELFPQCGACRYGLAAALLLGGRAEEAGEELDRAVARLPACGDPRYLKAFGLARAGKIAGAKAELDAVTGFCTDRRVLQLAYDLSFGLAAVERGAFAGGRPEAGTARRRAKQPRVLYHK